MDRLAYVFNCGALDLPLGNTSGQRRALCDNAAGFVPFECDEQSHDFIIGDRLGGEERVEALGVFAVLFPDAGGGGRGGGFGVAPG